MGGLAPERAELAGRGGVALDPARHEQQAVAQGRQRGDRLERDLALGREARAVLEHGRDSGAAVLDREVQVDVGRADWSGERQREWTEPHELGLRANGVESGGVLGNERMVIETSCLLTTEV